MIEFEYNKKKIIIFSLFSITLIILFGWTFLNAETLALKEPNSSYRHSWVGKLLYKNETLIKYFSAAIFLLFILFFAQLIKMFIKLKVTFKIENGKLFADKNCLTEINEITHLKLKNVNKNYFINIYLKNPQKLIENEPNFFKKITYKIVNSTENTPLSLNIDFLKNKPEKTVKELSELLNKKLHIT